MSSIVKTRPAPTVRHIGGEGYYASSREVADWFGLPHATVITAIDRILQAGPQYQRHPDPGNFRPEGDEVLMNSPGFLLVAAALPRAVTTEERLVWMDAFAAAKALADSSRTRVHVHAKEELPTLKRPEGVDASRMPVVFERDGEIFADSRDVAVYFGKEHKHVLRDIRNLIASEPKLGRSNFGPFKINDLTGESTSHYIMDRDGFTLLAMGFTGTKALGFKLKYIEAFNAMEAELRRRPAVDPSALLNDPASLRNLLAGYTEKVIALEGRVGELAPKAEALDRLTDADGAVNPTVAAKTLGVPPKRLFRYMRENRWIYRRPGGRNVAYQQRIERGELDMKVTTLRLEDGSERILEQVLVTPKGLASLAKGLAA